METKKNVSRNRTTALLLTLVMLFATMPTIVLASGTYAGIAPAVGGVYDSLVTTTVAALRVHSTSADSAYIDLRAETINSLPAGFTPTQFSVNGSGGRWRNIPRAGLDASLSTWLNRASNISIRNTPATGDAIVINFPAIAARPRANTETLRLYYSVNGDWDNWELRVRNRRSQHNGVPWGSPDNVYKWVEGDATNGGRLPSNPNWQGVPAYGFPIRNPGESRPLMFFRLAASYTGGIYTPASRIFSVRPRNIQSSRLLNVINYANEQFRFPANTVYSTDGGLTWSQPLITREQRRMDASEYITSGTTIRFASMLPHGRIPRRAIAEFTTLPRAEFADWTVTPEIALVLCPQTHRFHSVQDNGRTLRSFQVYRTRGCCRCHEQELVFIWRNMTPLLPESTEYSPHLIRARHTARHTRVNGVLTWQGYAASLPMHLVVTRSSYLSHPSSPNSFREGIESAIIRPIPPSQP